MNMSSLQIGLAIVGGVVLLAMFVHSTWSSRRNIPRQAVPEPGGEDDQTREAIEPELDVAAFDVAHFPVPQIDKRSTLDALIDVIAPIALDAPVSGEAALVALPSTRRAGSKPFAVEGLSEASQAWETPQPGQRYSAFQAGVQLANRSGPLNEIEYSEFVIKTQAFGDAVNGTPDFPEMLEEVARARELDQFASEHDAQLGFVLRATNAAWSPGYVQQNASRLGFIAGSMPGRMVVPSALAGMPAVLCLSFDTQAALAEDPAQTAIREMTLSLDVAQVNRSERPFVRMREAAQSLAATMDGVVTDDNGLTLSSEAMDGIGAELERLYDTLDQRDLSAGSVAARRLFS